MQLDRQGWLKHYGETSSRFNPMQRRLMHEHLLLAELCESDDDLEYKVIEAENLPPRSYRVSFLNLPGFLSIGADLLPVIGNYHVMEINLPSGYPLEPPVSYMVTPAWHPNIQHEAGPYQGRICGNTEAFGSFFSLDELVLRVRSMLKYETYHAALHFPYPEDEEVARWVREVAEPAGMVKKGIGIGNIQNLPKDWKDRLKNHVTPRVRM